MVFIAGETRNATLPVTAGTVQTSCLFDTGAQCYDNVGYVAAFDITKSGANSLAWATYVSGPNNPNTSVGTQLNAIAADSENNVYLTGYTTDALFPVTKGAFATTCPLDSRSGSNYCDNDVFVNKLNSTGTAMTGRRSFRLRRAPPQAPMQKQLRSMTVTGYVDVYGDSGLLTFQQ